MAEHHPTPPQPQRPPKPTSASAATTNFLRKLHDHAPNPTHLIAFLAVLLLSGAAITAAAIGLIFFTPLIVVSSPIWVPICTFLFVAAAGFLSVCGFGVSVVAGSSWLYKYFRGFNPPGADRVDYARSRIYDTASHVKDYAREYGGYLQSKAKDAAPGA